MRLLLDAHAFLWWVTNSTRLSEMSRNAIGDQGNEIAVGIGCLWELAIKRSIGKLDFPFDFQKVLQDEGFEVLQIGFGHLRILDTLPRHHGDPFDRLLIAQSLLDGLPIITNDSLLSRYAVTIIW
jgi:PIN domain nuclease of toxin-antitoxin system